MNMMRGDRRRGRCGEEDWVPLNDLLARNRIRLADRTDVVCSVCWDTHRGSLRFDVAWELDPHEEDGYTYWIKVNKHLTRNKDGE